MTDVQLLNEALGTFLQNNPWLIAVLIWVIIWKGLALWQAAQHKQKIWFIALLIVNTLGILEIIYLLIIRWHNKSRPINPIAPKHFSEPKNPNLP